MVKQIVFSPLISCYLLILQLIALKIDEEEKKVTEYDVANAKEVIKTHTQAHGSVCFVVRRPGERQVKLFM